MHSAALSQAMPPARPAQPLPSQAPSPTPQRPRPMPKQGTPGAIGQAVGLPGPPHERASRPKMKPPPSHRDRPPPSRSPKRRLSRDRPPKRRASSPRLSSHKRPAQEAARGAEVSDPALDDPQPSRPRPQRVRRTIQRGQLAKDVPPQRRVRSPPGPPRRQGSRSPPVRRAAGTSRLRSRRGEESIPASLSPQLGSSSSVSPSTSPIPVSARHHRHSHRSANSARALLNAQSRQPVHSHPIVPPPGFLEWERDQHLAAEVQRSQELAAKRRAADPHLKGREVRSHCGQKASPRRMPPERK